jgi:cation diffusion facilitator family transporter
LERSHHDATADVHDWYRQTRRAALNALGVTLLLGIAKLAGGWYGHSLALLSDSVHSLGDALASAAIWASLWWAEQPADREHPYGHARIESIAASTVALFLILSGIWIAWEAIVTWSVLKEPPRGYTLWIASASVVLNELIFRSSRRIAERTGSQALQAAAWDQRLDVFGSMVVLVGLATARWGGPSMQKVDHIAVFAVAGIILWAGGALYWASLQVLMDRQADPELLETIRELARGVEGVRGLDKLRVRKTGLEYLVDIHVEVSPDISVSQGHGIGHAVKDRLVKQLTAVKDVLVHIEPDRK